MDELFQSFGHVLQNILPLSPFRNVILQAQDIPCIGWINWLVPVGSLLEIFGAWLIAYAGFILYQIVLRWLKVIQG